MKFGIALMATLLFAAGSAVAQVSPAGAQQPAQQRPAPAAVQPGAQSSQSPSLAANAKVDPQKEKAIRHLMELTGSTKMGDNMSQVITGQVKSAMSRNMPGDRLQQFMDAFGQKFNARNPTHDVSEAMVPIYASHFSTGDIQGLIQFYESPLGKRMVSTMPQVMQESQSAGASIERTAAISTLTEMADQYPELKPMLPHSQAEPETPQAPSAAPGTAPAPPAPAPSPRPTPPPR
ncbi:MAG: DUF2059 domain-containing protein [Candidatus Acidiferrales bacterium]